MNDCQHDIQLSAYYDGELDAAARTRMVQHLEICSACAAKLREWVGVSELFARDVSSRDVSSRDVSSRDASSRDASSRDVSAPHLSQIGLHRLHSRVEYLYDGGLFRLARVMIGLAATVLVVGSVWLTQSRPAAPMAESVTQMALQLEEQPPVVAEPSPSDWIVAELSH